MGISEPVTSPMKKTFRRTKTLRGFGIRYFNDRYDAPCSIQESSLATEAAIWLGVNDAQPKVMASEAASVGVQTDQTTGWVTYPIPDNVQLTTRMHLTIPMVRKLLPVLQKFVETGTI
jgi:hypothetical protein